jgi:hypothetical protein
MKKIIISLVLAALCLSANAQTINETPEANFQVELNKAGDGVIITRYTGRAAQVRIPAKIQGMPVVEIGETAFNKDRAVAITRIIIPEGITTIGRLAFYKQDFTQLELPNTVTTINEGAFNECKKLASVTLPSSLVNIGGSIGVGVFGECEALTKVTLSEGIRYIGEFMFENCEKLKEIVIPESVTEIMGNAFNKTGLTSITFKGNKLAKIGEYAFNGVSLINLILPEGLTEIGESAFSGCRSLKTLTLPSTIKKIGTEAFGYCSSLTTVTVPASVTKIEFITRFDGAHAFSNSDNLNLASQAALKKVGWSNETSSAWW